MNDEPWRSLLLERVDEGILLDVSAVETSSYLARLHPAEGGVMGTMAEDIGAALVERINRLPYPPTIYSHGWIYGLWYTSTAWRKAIYYGQFPSTFVKRVTAMFPPTKFRFLHLCCGRCHIDGAVNVDIKLLPEVDVVADAEALPFIANSFDVCLIDPPYSEQDANRYNIKRLLSAKRVMAQLREILIPGGWFLWLDEKYPSHSRKIWALRGLIGIVTGSERRTRALSMFRNLK